MISGIDTDMWEMGTFIYCCTEVKIFKANLDSLYIFVKI